MTVEKLLIYIFTMALTTYLVRMLPLVLMKKKIESNFINSFLYYLPYAVLTSMTIPGIFYSTSMVLSAAVGLLVAGVLAMFNRGLLVVALGASAAVFITEYVMTIL